MKITLKDGNIKNYDNAMTAYDIARDVLSDNGVKDLLCCTVNGETKDLSFVIDKDCELDFLDFNSKIGKDAFRHTAAHVLAQAIKNIYPTAKLAIGPAITNGFYYDIDFDTPITSDDFPKIEQEMKRIVKANYVIERHDWTRKDALEYMKGIDEDYKVEIINDLPEDAKFSYYTQGPFRDLCVGPHIRRTGQIKAFKLTSLTGAYWRGDENRKMLSRIYGTAFPTKEMLNEYITSLEEAKKRDHNKLGRELGYFMTDEKIGQGLPLLMPKGAKLMQVLQRFVEDEEERRGYVFTKTPLMAKSDLYKISGHWDHYKDGMFILGDESKDKEVLALRPMTCPFQYTIYNNGIKSYRDLPLRMAETSTLFRNEASGEMHGLIRVRQFTLSDAHIMCLPSQLESEFKGALDLIYYILKCIGLLEDVTFRFSRYDPNDKVKYIDDKESWEAAESSMERILKDLNIDYVEGIGEAAFYGPKLDIQIKNVFGKEDTAITIQVDMFLAHKFNMRYIDEDGEEKHPYIVHRSSIGCYERTMALIIEKFAGKLPTWMAPVQVKAISLTDRTIPQINALTEKLREHGIRVETDTRSETVGYKVREAKLERVPYIAVIGDRDAENGVVAVRDRSDKQRFMTADELLNEILQKVKNKVID